MSLTELEKWMESQVQEVSRVIGTADKTTDGDAYVIVTSGGIYERPPLEEDRTWHMYGDAVKEFKRNYLKLVRKANTGYYSTKLHWRAKPVVKEVFVEGKSYVGVTARLVVEQL